MIRVLLPYHLRTLAGVRGEVTVEIEGRPTVTEVLDAVEARYPQLCGTIRDRATKERRPFVRFYVCAEDWTMRPPDIDLPPAIAEGAEPLMVIGAMAGG